MAKDLDVKVVALLRNSTRVWMISTQMSCLERKRTTTRT